MINIFKKNQVAFLNILLSLLVLPLLYIITLANLENIYQFNFSYLYTNIYFSYLLFGTLILFFIRFFKLSNNILKEEVSYTIKIIFLLSIFILPSFFINHFFIVDHLGESNLYLRSYGRIAFFYFALALLISPILKNIKSVAVRDYLILSRKTLGILSFIFFLKHGLEYFSSEYIFQIQFHSDKPYLQYIYENMLVRYDAISGFVAGIMMFLLGITSNKISVKLLSGKGWKKVQSLVYPTFLISLIHVAFASRFDNFYIFLFAIVVLFRTLYYNSNKQSDLENNDKVTTKYICIPCGYIYDENVGDPDSGIIPGTKFKDIPDDWYCPVCGVGKSDFEPYFDKENNIFGGYLGDVISNNMLTEDVLELILKINSDVKVLKGQYAILNIKDFDGEFARAYSIVKAKNNTLTFGIKLNETGRGGRALKNLKIGDQIKVKGIYGTFLLKETTNQKVFIATGTGLSPIMNMISEPLPSKNNYLFFGAQLEKDLFYIDKMNSVEDLAVNIYISREKTDKYNYGRIDLTNFEFNKDAEFYICGNPGLVASTKEYLVNAGYSNVYIEKY